MRAAVASLALLSLSAFGPAESHHAHQISRSGRGAYEASLAPSADGFVAAWYDTRHGSPEIYARNLDAEGRPAGAEMRLTHGSASAYEPDVQAFDAGFVIAWYEQDPLTRAQTARLGMWTHDGRPRWITTLSTSGRNGRNPLVRISRGRLFCAWLEASATGQALDVWALWLDSQGHEVAPRRRIAPAGTTTWNLNAAVDASGDAWLVFDAQAGTRADELFLARIDETSSRLDRLTTDDGFASKYPDVAIGDRGVALTWFDERDGNQEVYLVVGAAGEMTEGLESRARRVTNTPGESIGAYVAWNGDRVGLAWCDNTPGQDEVYFQRFDDRGVPVSGAVRLTHNRTQSLIPAIRPWRETFALVWNEFMPGRKGVHADDGRSEVVFQLAPR